jgi:aldehyde dehydrogenase (NAD+)
VEGRGLSGRIGGHGEHERARRLYIDDEWREVSDGSAAVGAARTAFDTTNWSTDLPFRKRCMRQLEQGPGKVTTALGDMATREAGIPTRKANLIDSVIEEVSSTIELFDRFGWEVDLPPAEMLSMTSDRRGRRRAARSRHGMRRPR